MGDHGRRPQNRVGRPRTSAIGSKEAGARLAGAMRAAGLTPSVVARHIGYFDARTVRSWISGDSGPDKQRAAHLTYLLADASVYGWWSWPENDPPSARPSRDDPAAANASADAAQDAEAKAEQPDGAETGLRATYEQDPGEHVLAGHRQGQSQATHRFVGISVAACLAALGAYALFDQTGAGTTATPSDSKIQSPAADAGVPSDASAERVATPADSGAVEVVTDSPPVQLDLSAGDALFTVPDRWVIHAEPQGGDRCTFQVGSADEEETRFVFGESLLVHGRQAGTYAIKSPNLCAIEVAVEMPGGRGLPFTLDSTGQSSDTVVFESPGPFAVTLSGGADCGSATVFDDTNALKVEASIGPDSTRRFMGGGTYWVSTERYGCSVAIDPST